MRQQSSLACTLLFAFVALFVGPWSASAQTVNVDPLRPLPVLDHGRVKPFDTVARESVRFITGSEFFGPVKDGDQGQEITGKMDPVALVLDWTLHQNEWSNRPVLYVPLLALRAKIGLSQTQKWISPRQLTGNSEFVSWVRGLEEQKMAAEQTHERIVHANAADARLEDSAIELDNRLGMFEAAVNLTLYPVLPDQNPKQPNWIPLGTIAFASQDQATNAQTDWIHLLQAYKNNDNGAFAASAEDLIKELRYQAGDGYADAARMDREVFYNSFKPFRKAWVFYLIAVAALIGALMSKKNAVYAIAMAIFISAIGFHVWGFIMRCRITGWAPVTNMYETVIWVAMMGAIFSLILELIYRRRVIAIGGATVALLATVIADNMPPEYGSAIRNLTPVLRSNYWLTIHVLTIVSSYAAFALALILGNIVLGQFMFKADKASIRTNLQFIYRAIQIGVLLVAAGTILGGLWADQSWGRFWGWDPKEVWALIVLLIYLAILHGRYAGWIKQFGLAASAVVGFTAVLMSWYGVNFVLGAGLHAYGFGSGGQFQVGCFVVAQWIFVGIAFGVYHMREGNRNAISYTTTVPQA